MIETVPESIPEVESPVPASVPLPEVESISVPTDSTPKRSKPTMRRQSADSIDTADLLRQVSGNSASVPPPPIPAPAGQPIPVVTEPDPVPEIDDYEEHESDEYYDSDYYDDAYYDDGYYSSYDEDDESYRKARWITRLVIFSIVFGFGSIFFKD